MTQNIYDTMVEAYGHDRKEAKLTIIGAPYGLPLDRGNRQQIWEDFTDLIRVSPELMEGKGWLADTQPEN